MNFYPLSRQLKSKIHTYDTSVENTTIQNGYGFVKPPLMVWTGFSDENTEGIYLSEDGQDIGNTELNWKLGEPSGENFENCAAIQHSKQIIDRNCEEEMLTTCKIDEVLEFTLHNMDSVFPELNNKFVLHVEDISETQVAYKFQSYDGSTIEYVDSKWEFVNSEGNSLMSLGQFGFPIGHTTWTDDCLKDQPGMTIIFDACNITEFGCRDGTCISMYKRCNEQQDCPAGKSNALKVAC